VVAFGGLPHVLLPIDRAEVVGSIKALNHFVERLVVLGRMFQEILEGIDLEGVREPLGLAVPAVEVGG
jgi:predicted xylose isomerase-like sugar epimerase